MSGAGRRAPYVRHAKVAARAKAAPNTWVHAATYASVLTARSTMSEIRGAGKKHLRAYDPIGAWATELRPQPGAYAVWVRYTAQPAVNDIHQQEN